MFLYNELHQCGVYDQGYASYRKYEHNTIKAGAAYEEFQFENFLDQNANHIAHTYRLATTHLKKDVFIFWMVTSMTTLQLAYISITTPLEAAVTE